jgi:hypothetical protein
VRQEKHSAGHAEMAEEFQRLSAGLKQFKEKIFAAAFEAIKPGAAKRTG